MHSGIQKRLLKDKNMTSKHISNTFSIQLTDIQMECIIVGELQRQLEVALKYKEDKEEIKLAMSLKDVLQFYMEPDAYKKYIKKLDCKHIHKYDSSRFVIGL